MRRIYVLIFVLLLIFVGFLLFDASRVKQRCGYHLYKNDKEYPENVNWKLNQRYDFEKIKKRAESLGMKTRLFEEPGYPKRLVIEYKISKYEIYQVWIDDPSRFYSPDYQSMQILVEGEKEEPELNKDYIKNQTKRIIAKIGLDMEWDENSDIIGSCITATTKNTP